MRETDRERERHTEGEVGGTEGEGARGGMRDRESGSERKTHTHRDARERA